MEETIQRHPWEDLAIRAAAVVLAVSIGAASIRLSFTTLADIAVRSHVPPENAWLWPYSVDGAIILATLGAVVCRSDPSARRFFWAVLIGGLLVSIGGNDLHAVLPPDQELHWALRAVVGAVAPIAAVLSIHGLTILLGRIQPRRIADQRVTFTPQHAVHPQEVASPASSHTATTGPDLPTRDEAPTPTAAAGRDRTDTGSAALPYADLADKVLGIITVKDIEPAQISEVLRMSYEHNLPNRDIGRRLALRHHTVGKIIDASAQVLRDEPLAKVS